MEVVAEEGSSGCNRDLFILTIDTDVISAKAAGVARWRLGFWHFVLAVIWKARTTYFTSGVGEFSVGCRHFFI